MIDINKAKVFYKEYISNYNPENPRTALKIAHIYRVSENARKIAEDLKLSEEDIKLAELIGLLHDIGRFEQIKIYNTFSDKNSINHAELGIKILFEEELIKNFIEERKYDEIIYKAIINHNKDKISEELTDRELLHAKIIRDADKLDILYNITFEDTEIIYGGNKLYNPITKEIYEQYLEKHIINYNDMKQEHDLLIGHIAFIFDINFNYTLMEIKENNYIEKLLRRLEFKNEILKEQIEIAYNQAKEYMNNRLIEE